MWNCKLTIKYCKIFRDSSRTPFEEELSIDGVPRRNYAWIKHIMYNVYCTLYIVHMPGITTGRTHLDRDILVRALYSETLWDVFLGKFGI